MIITHFKYGEVEGVECQIPQSRWWKLGANYYFGDGWREKMVERWVEEAISLAIGCTTSLYGAGGKDIRLRCVERYDLPDRWLVPLFGGNIYLIHVLEQYKKPCLIVERKQSCQQQQK